MLLLVLRESIGLTGITPQNMHISISSQSGGRVVVASVNCVVLGESLARRTATLLVDTLALSLCLPLADFLIEDVSAIPAAPPDYFGA